MPYELTIDQQGLAAVARALKAREDGKELRKDLSRNLKNALDPAVNEIKSGLMAIGHAGLPTEGEPLRAAVAKGIKAQARLSGRTTGARIAARRTTNLRGFYNAAKSMQLAGGWRHPVYGNDVWVPQTGTANYFDDATAKRHDECRKTVLEAMEEIAAEIVRAGE